MATDAVERVLTRYRESEYQEPIRHTINFLIAYWNSKHAEDQISAAFTAFETIVNGIGEVRGESHILDQSDFTELRKEVQVLIKEFAKKKGLDKDTRKRLYDKIGELQRPAITPRAVALVEEYGVEWHDLFRDAIPEPILTTELQKAYGRRSVLVHAGRVDDYGTLLANAASVHALAERLIYSLLGGQREWLHPVAYYYAQPRWI
jgi:hypothetical protein